MHRTLPVARRVIRGQNAASRIIRQHDSRSFSSSSATLNSGSASTSSPPKKRGFFRTLALYSSGLILVFYATSPVIAFNNERYNAFFVESIPLGEPIIEYAEEHGWDKALKLTFLQSSKDRLQQIYDNVAKNRSKSVPPPEHVEKPKESVKEKVQSAKATVSERAKETKEVLKEANERLHEVVETLKTKTGKAAKKTEEVLGLSSPAPSKTDKGLKRPEHFSEGVEELVKNVEAALSGKPIEIPHKKATTSALPVVVEVTAQKTAELAESVPKGSEAKKAGHEYPSELPLGFEPPPGFSRPTPPPAPSKEERSGPIELPLVAPVVADVVASEPVIVELATSIDTLASYLKDSPASAAQVRGILDTAQTDLKELVSRIDHVRAEEHSKLEAKLNEQAREYNSKLLETELLAQDKLDEQELEFKQFFEDERKKMIQLYQQKLDNELRAQSEIINERLKAEVIAQGIELQRRWIREVKVHVEEERGGRLSKLEELATNLKRLERVALDNAEYLEENLRLHSFWAALRSLNSKSIESPERQPFRDELRILRHASGAKESLVSSVLDSLEATDIPDIGVEPLADLTTWFSTSVAPQVARVALVPEHDAGVLSYLASHFFSSFRFHRHGLVEGDDVLSTLSRAEFYLNEKDLDSAARELNQLKGAPKTLMADWLDAARRRLEVLQALEVLRTQATLNSLLVV